eukprot:scaffold1420_cov375-Pavlova_lutheri.AAC.34
MVDRGDRTRPWSPPCPRGRRSEDFGSIATVDFFPLHHHTFPKLEGGGLHEWNDGAAPSSWTSHVWWEGSTIGPAGITTDSFERDALERQEWNRVRRRDRPVPTSHGCSGPKAFPRTV